ncbi:MAG: hypothetical protein AAGM46_27865, partial [Cyanobacteria bacterium J06582_2]
VITEVEEVQGVRRRSQSWPTLGFSGATRRSLIVCNKLMDERKKDSKKKGFKLFSSSFSSKGTRRFYSTGPQPSFDVSSEFESVVDTKRSKLLHRQKIWWNLTESDKQMKSYHSALETSSFVGWHLGSLSEKVASAIEDSKRYSSSLTSKLEDVAEVINVLDKAQSSSIHLQTTGLANQVVKKRLSYVDLCDSAVSASEKAKLLYGPLDFHQLFSEADIKKISSGLDSKDSRVIAKRSIQTPWRGGSSSVLDRPSRFTPSSSSSSVPRHQRTPTSKPSSRGKPKNRGGGRGRK